MSIKSPLTASENVQLISHYHPSITSDSRIVAADVHNYICLDTGIVFNGSGARGGESGFYIDEYDLHSESTLSEFRYFDADSVVGIYDSILNFVGEGTKIQPGMSMLDIGCGKGVFLRKAQKKYPELKLSGVEPSKNAKSFFAETMNGVALHEGMLETSPFLSQQFDLITANGVLEHVPDPIAFLKNIIAMMTDQSTLYIGVPNFENNPADYFTYDHLFRFTSETVKVLFDYVGLEVVSELVSSQRVPMWFLLKKKKPTGDLVQKKDFIKKCKTLANRNKSAIDAVFASYNRAAQSARVSGKKVILYGTGAFGLIAPYYCDLDKSLIECMVDDNQSIWGATRESILIQAPEKAISTSPSSEVVISANPCYFKIIQNKLDQLKTQYDFQYHMPQEVA